jgi:hypothetical protein
MRYIGVAPQDQANFQYKVTEAQKDFSGYSYPTTKEEYWAIVDKYWPEIKDILLKFTYLDPDDLDKWAKERNSEIASVFNDAWFNAPDNGRIHLIPAWHIFCDLCSETYLLNNNV